MHSPVTLYASRGMWQFTLEMARLCMHLLLKQVLLSLMRTIVPSFLSEESSNGIQIKCRIREGAAFVLNRPAESVKMSEINFMGFRLLTKIGLYKINKLRNQVFKKMDIVEKGQKKLSTWKS